MKALTIRSGSVRVRIFRSPSRVKGKIYLRHEIRWTDHHGQRRRLKRSNLAEARREASRLAEDLARGHHHAELSLADLASFRLARQHLYGTGRSIEQACGEYAILRTALRATGRPMPPLADLAAVWQAHLTARALPALPTVAAAVAAYLLTKSQQGVSPRWQATLRGQLARFSVDHQTDIGCITASIIQRWFLNLPGLGARSKNNHLAAVQSLFHAPELRQHPERQSILDLQPCAESHAVNQLWTPKEFRRLLDAAPAHLLPVLVLGGFAKLRSSEIMRLDWSAVHLSETRLLLRAGQTKTKRLRIVPLPPCAVAWLRISPIPPIGPIWPWREHKLHHDLRALAAGCGLQWRPNALRNSAVTYDQILNPDVARVAREAGNSARILETEYFALEGVTKRTARQWFALRPETKPNQIIKLHERTA